MRKPSLLALSSLLVASCLSPTFGQEATPTRNVDLDNSGSVDATDIFAFISYWHSLIDSGTPTETPTFTPTMESPTETPTLTPTATPTATDAGPSFNIADYFVLTPGTNWTFGVPGKGQLGEGFSWLVLDSPVDLGDGLMVTSIQTIGFSTDFTRHLDEDLWSFDEITGHLLFHGIRESVGFDINGTNISLPAQDLIIDPPVDFGGADLSIGEVISTTASVSVIADIPPFGEQEIVATAYATVTYSEFLPTFSTELGEFTDVIKLSVNIRAVVDLGLTDLETEFLNNCFYVKEGVGLVAIDLDPETGGADLLTISDGEIFINGSPVEILPE
ncbi:MAG: hypothetical protein KC964_05735 [Candidatus Omnitrophica bacterium]|nr:hypothetical protein [Candidatus Omnitrophota bacterium]MCA9437651.1 hypothetical protein [Candidatus Omnitrophota bacterium]MCA9440289.1 hypothetical protein [Candidatus Omnitrophota bacterium]